MVRTCSPIRVWRLICTCAWVLAAWNSAAGQVKIPDTPVPKISGFAVIDRVITTGSEPVFRADGYTMRVYSGTDVRLPDSASSGELRANTWISYEGWRDESGQIILSAAHFIQPKPHKTKRDPKVSLAQVTTFTRGS